ncbi:hypothetical protein TTHERM_00052610 (macronuclear) [Tetrahymena thermophila SB210]|uniref:Uncharacterized protein n=1 Tax=Tetrahymena thermophila (strain SB210) TaxID=312017 RepID=Q23CS9_TETTS|nr:hypothetical protein TTHERM_00052610 [Tetrahymena thermophila SB210]EAR94508.1 hypothetical protein TTHERM_00052610 [Tetrahymena thermophila SB210]|eukprot:XP_001014957.1 hypothetical protein TTHERM_00052610 [Tetrahymena thermophila SB210]
MDPKTTQITIDKKVLQKTKALFSFVKSKIPLIKGSAENTPSNQSSTKNQSDFKQSQQQQIIHEEDFQLKIDNVCNADLLESIEKLINSNTEQRELVISDQLFSEISFMMLRVADFVQFTLNEREEVAQFKQDYQSLKKENEQLKSVIDGFNDSMIQYENSHKKEFIEMQVQYQNEIEALNKQIEILIQEKNLQKKLQDEQIVALINVKEHVNQLTLQNNSLQNTLNTLNIEMVKLKAIHQGEVSDTMHEKSFKSIMTSKNTKHRILSFLTFKQILKLRLLNREYNLIITRDFQLQRLLINNIAFNFTQKTRELYNRANFFQSLAENIPDEVLKVSILKYLCQRHKVGDLMVPSLNSAQLIIEGLLFQSESESNGSTSNLSTRGSIPQSPQSSFINSTNNDAQQLNSGNVDLLSEFLTGEENVNINENQQQQLQQEQNKQSIANNKVNGSSQPQENTPQAKQSKTQKTISFMKKLFDKKETPTNADNSQKAQTITNVSRNTLEKTFLSNENVTEEIANKLIQDMNIKLLIDNRVLQLFREEKDIVLKQLKIEQDEVIQKIQALTVKYSQDPKKISYFLETLESSFCNIYVFSKFLYQESKALYNLQSYLSYELIQNKMKLQDVQNKLEDTTTSKQALEQMKDYLSQKLKETEKKNLQSDTIFLKNNKLIQELKDDNNNLQQKIQSIEKSKIKSDNNLKILAKEVRNLMRKNTELTAKYEKLLKNMNYLKEALSNFKILEE